MSRTARTHLSILAIVAALVWLLIWGSGVPWGVAVWCAAWGCVTFFYYGYDKRQAGHGGWRVPETILHLLAISGGFAGGWLGMFFFHHKTREPIFAVVLALATAVWGGLLLWLALG